MKTPTKLSNVEPLHCIVSLAFIKKQRSETVKDYWMLGWKTRLNLGQRQIANVTKKISLSVDATTEKSVCNQKSSKKHDCYLQL
jgi:hypothetical protein